MDPKEAYEEEVGEEPVDYSKNYIERDHRNSEVVTVAQESQNIGSGKTFKCGRSAPLMRGSADALPEFSMTTDPKKVDLFGDYAETDLDQPTDYSLRYAEDDTDEDEKEGAYFVGVQEDTLKTYCTEGTPYETPLNFSTATSMSDLRLEDSKDGDTLKRVKKPVHNNAVNPVRCKEESVPRRELEKSPVSKAPPVLDDVPLGEEKLTCYYESSTPDAFPRVNSLSSLGSTNAQQNVSESSKTSDDVKPVVLEISNVVSESLNLQVSETPEPDVAPEKSARVIDKEGKMVTFGGEDFYAEQTPLMFSRSSSLGSLSGFEQFSIHDDRSSIVSDFSRRTSGIVSPSELPDSPTQTAPPSPGNRKNQCADFVSKIPEEAVRPSIRHLSFSKSPNTRTSVFEDDIATFKEESTPIEFSTATSLSSLTIDDEVKIQEILEVPKSEGVPQNSISPEETRESQKETTFAEKACQVEVSEVEKDQEQVSDADEGDDDDEDILAACITRGMQNNRYRQSFKPNDTKPTQGVLGRCPRTTPVTKVLPETSTLKGKQQIETAVPDSVHVYCTEDTPADISPVGSQSNLSVLSMPSVREDVREDKEASDIGSHRNDLSDESSNLSGEDEKILDACIQSGMPKVRQTPPLGKSIVCGVKADGVTQRFNICGTPSSSPVESGNGKSTVMKTGENEPEFSDDSLNHSDDEAMLTECIRSAMPKARLNISPLTGLSSQNTAKCKPALLHPAKVNQVPAYFQPRYNEQSKKQQRPAIPFESNISLSEEDEDEDNILAQCIRSGIPRALNGSSITSSTSSKKIETLKPRILEPSTNFYKSRTCSNRDVGTQVTSTPHIHQQTQRSSIDPESSNFSRFQVKVNDRNKCSRNSRSLRQGIERMTLKDHQNHPSGSRYPITSNDHQEIRHPPIRNRDQEIRLSSLNNVRSRGSPMTPADHQEIIRLASNPRSRGSPMTPAEHQEIIRLASSSNTNIRTRSTNCPMTDHQEIRLTSNIRSRPTNSSSPMTPSDYQEMIRLASSNGARTRANDHQEIIQRSLQNTSVRSRNSNCGSPMLNGQEHYEDDDSGRNHGKSSNVAPSRHSSVSSLSEEGSLGSIEEWALLELCINSALPRNRCRLKSTKVQENHEEREAINEDSYSICSYSSYVCKT